MNWLLLCAVVAALAACLAVFWAVCRAASRADRAYILPLSGRREDAEWILRRVAWQWRWGTLEATRVTVIDMGLDADTADTVRRLCDRLGFDYVLVKKP